MLKIRTHTCSLLCTKSVTNYCRPGQDQMWYCCSRGTKQISRVVGVGYQVRAWNPGILILRPYQGWFRARVVRVCFWSHREAASCFSWRAGMPQHLYLTIHACGMCVYMHVHMLVCTYACTHTYTYTNAKYTHTHPYAFHVHIRFTCVDSRHSSCNGL